MTPLEKIVEHLMTMPESAQTEVLGFVGYLKCKKDRRGDSYNWGKVSLNFAVRGIAEEASPYEVQDIKEKF